MTTQVQGHTVTRRFYRWQSAARWKIAIQQQGGWMLGVGYRRGLLGLLRGRYTVTMITSED